MQNYNINAAPMVIDFMIADELFEESYRLKVVFRQLSFDGMSLCRAGPLWRLVTTPQENPSLKLLALIGQPDKLEEIKLEYDAVFHFSRSIGESPWATYLLPLKTRLMHIRVDGCLLIDSAWSLLMATCSNVGMTCCDWADLLWISWSNGRRDIRCQRLSGPIDQAMGVRMRRIFRRDYVSESIGVVAVLNGRHVPLCDVNRVTDMLNAVVHEPDVRNPDYYYPLSIDRITCVPWYRDDLCINVGVDLYIFERARD